LGSQIPIYKNYCKEINSLKTGKLKV